MVDLLDSGGELSPVAHVLADALERGLVDEEGALRETIDPGGHKPGVRWGPAPTIRLLGGGKSDVLERRSARQGPEEGRS